MILRLTETRKSFVSKNDTDRTSGITRTWRLWPGSQVQTLFSLMLTSRAQFLKDPWRTTRVTLRTEHQRALVQTLCSHVIPVV